MQSAVKSQVFLRKRKMLIVLPLLVIPFLTLVFYALGGGSTGQATGHSDLEGLNLRLPDVTNKEEQLMDKLGFYEKAQKDSMKLAEWMRNDPYYKQPLFVSDTTPNEIAQIHQATASKYHQTLNASPYEKSGKAPEEKIMQKIALLQKEMNKNPASANQQSKKDNEITSDADIATQVNRLEEMMHVMSKDSDADPEIRQLENTLDKILDIQHPQRVKNRLKERSLQETKSVFHVSKVPNKPSISLLGHSKTQISGVGFYGLLDDMNTVDQNAIEAVVHENQTLVNGSVVKLRLVTDVYIAGNEIPKGSFVFGIATLNNERLEIEINSIQHRSSLYPVKLKVFDLDGLSGIYVPGAITRDVAKQSAENSLQLMELSTMDPSLKAQAASAGINAAKSLVSKKVKLVKLLVKAGYKVLLKGEH